MIVQKVEVWKHKIICLLQDCEKGQRYLIDRDLITIIELNVFSHFIYNFGKTLLDHTCNKLIMNQHFSFFLSLVKWQLNNTSHDSEILRSNIGVFVPIGTITQLCDTPKHDWVSNVMDCILSQNIVGSELNCRIETPQESSNGQGSNARIQKPITSLLL